MLIFFKTKMLSIFIYDPNIIVFNVKLRWHNQPTAGVRFSVMSSEEITKYFDAIESREIRENLESPIGDP